VTDHNSDHHNTHLLIKRWICLLVSRLMGYREAITNASADSRHGRMVVMTRIVS